MEERDNKSNKGGAGFSFVFFFQRNSQFIPGRDRRENYPNWILLTKTEISINCFCWRVFRQFGGINFERIEVSNIMSSNLN